MSSSFMKYCRVAYGNLKDREEKKNNILRK